MTTPANIATGVYVEDSRVAAYDAPDHGRG